jgi:hypothetical protein
LFYEAEQKEARRDECWAFYFGCELLQLRFFGELRSPQDDKLTWMPKSNGKKGRSNAAPLRRIIEATARAVESAPGFVGRNRMGGGRSHATSPA